MSNDYFYDGFCTPSGYEHDHVFDRAFNNSPVSVGAYFICRCGDYKKKYCRCLECGDGHWRIVATNENEQLRHEIMKINLRLAVLESGPRTEPEGAAVELTQ